MNKIYLLMNKPAGYVCKAVADRNKTVFELLPPELQALVQGAKRGERLHTVGRLDLDTTGLLLLTTDGKFSNRLTDPAYAVEKRYQVTLENEVTPDEQKVYVRAAGAGVLLPAEKKAGEEMSAGAEIVFIDKDKTDTRCNNFPAATGTTSRCIITVTEGKFHEVRRLFRALGNKVVELKRIQMGTLQLDSTLAEGSYRELTQEELDRLAQL